MAQPFHNHNNNSTNTYNYNNNSQFNNRPTYTQQPPPKPSKPPIDAQTIFHDPTSSSDPRWHWRTTMEASRKDPRNIPFYSNYVGSKGARSFEKNQNSSNKKPDHYKKHLAKIGCPLHDLYDIFHKDLGFSIHPTICAHKSWKCPSFSSYSNNNTLATISFNDIGLEWKRGAFSVKPLHIEYDNIFSTDLYIKRIANTNFNKVFRPGCFGNLPSVKKGSWKQGKVFYVFKDDKLTLKISDNIQLIFQLSSPSTIIKSSKNKHDIIDGWKNIVGGVGFYTCTETQQNIGTVLILRKSTEFPIECIQQSKIKILVKGNNFGNKKLIIGSKTFRLNARYRNNDMDTDSSISTSVTPTSSPFYDSVGYNETKTCDENVVDNRLNSIIDTMKRTFEHDNSVLAQRNQLLNGKIAQLQTLNVQFMDLNGKLMQERDQLLSQINVLENKQNQFIHTFHQPPPTQPMISTSMNCPSNVAMISIPTNDSYDRRGRDRDRNRANNSVAVDNNRHNNRSRSRGRGSNNNNTTNGRAMINVSNYGDESSGDRSVSDRSIRSWSSLSYDTNTMNNMNTLNTSMISYDNNNNTMDTNPLETSMISMDNGINSPYYMNMNGNGMDDESMYMNMNNMNSMSVFDMNDNNSIMNTDPMFYATYTD